MSQDRVGDDYWKNMPSEEVATFLGTDGEGVDHPSRAWTRVHVGSKIAPSVLDVGCGPGRERENYDGLPNGFVYTGMDFAEPMLAECRKRWLGSRFVQADARGPWPFEDQEFDVVVVRHLLEHLGTIEPLREAARVLEKNGYLLLVFFHALVAGETVHGIDPTAEGVPSVQFARTEVMSLLAELGLTVLDRTLISTEGYDDANECIILARI